MSQFGSTMVAMATFPPRLAYAINVLKRLWPQCNHLRACFNQFDTPPALLLSFIREIAPQMTPEHTFEFVLANGTNGLPDLGCNNKMLWVDQCDGYYLSVDDDIEYAPNYVSTLVSAIDRYKGKCVCSFHGKIYERTADGINASNRTCYRFDKVLEKDIKVDVCGMGVGGFVPKQLGVTWDMFNQPKNSGDDEIMAAYCVERGIDRIVLKKAHRWLRQAKVAGYALFRDATSRSHRNHFLEDAFHTEAIPEDPIKISIVIPCHNCAGTIKRLLNKLIRQTFTDWECICVDDSAVDNSRRVIGAYAKQDKRIRLFENTQNPGAGENRNIGLRNAKGEYVWFVDSDDEFAFDKDGLGKIVKMMDQTPADVHVFPTQMKINGSAVPSSFDITIKDRPFYEKGLLHTEEVQTTDEIRAMFNTMKIVPWNKIFNRQFLNDNAEEVFFQNTHFANDNHFSIQVLRHFRTIAFHKTEPIYFYHHSDKTISGVVNRSKNIGDIALLLSWLHPMDMTNTKDRWICFNRLKQFEEVVNQVGNYRLNQGEVWEDYLEEVARKIGKSLDSDNFKPFFKKFGTMKRIHDLFLSLPPEPKPEPKPEPTPEPIPEPEPEPTPPPEIPQPEPAEPEVDEPPAEEQDTTMDLTPLPVAHDAVFVLGTGSHHRDVEILLAIHSMRKFCPFIDRIFVVGSAPRCNLDKYAITHVPCQDPYTTNKDANMMFKVLHAINNIPDLTDDFLLCSDDQVVTQPCTWEDFKPKYVKSVTAKDLEAMKRSEANQKPWSHKMIRTLELALRRRSRVWFYEPHIWSPVNKEAFVKMVRDIGGLRNAGVIKSQYYNSIDKLDHEKLHDHRFFCSTSMDWSKEFAHPPKFLSYNDVALGVEEFRKQLALLLK